MAVEDDQTIEDHGRHTEGKNILRRKGDRKVPFRTYFQVRYDRGYAR